ncbi:hypothetical protein ILUMI_14385 [Ignelater luminosus]|uniref:Uncharacterized protein n=1 Tax=Ignelater luminosus TaxID=2038154 RepID=A0A8K0CQI9_IGNLU|nr:hypothetical protein ILUMI_14385 [Ignelater luminosus]
MTEATELYIGRTEIKKKEDRNKEKLLLGETTEKLNRWAEYFEDLLNKDEQIEPEGQKRIQRNDTEQAVEPTEQEIEDIIKKLKTNKSAGESGILVEILKKGGERLHERAHQLILKVWQEEKMPDQWRTALICPIPKKEDRTRCESHSRIAKLY